MSRSTNQKLKLYRLMEILITKTDENHGITMPQIIEELERYDITAERKSLYTDIEALEELGVVVETYKAARQTYYRVVKRQFELAELKLLVDAIQASKFITARKTNELIKKLEHFCSEHEARQLQRQVFVQNRIKTMNESIYSTVDVIHNAIAENRRIRFKYFGWNIKKEMELRHNGEYYVISPWALSWTDENYYLVGFDSSENRIKHFRVDKMLKISMIDSNREGKELFKKFNTADYEKMNFSMFGGEEEEVSILLRNDLCGIFIDRFGKDITFIPIDAQHSKVRLHVALSSHFLCWIFALGEGVKILGPEAVLEKVANEIARLTEQYSQGSTPAK